MPSVLFQPIAADDVAAAVAQVTVRAPLNNAIEIAGPDVFEFDEVIQHGLKAFGDSRNVVADSHAGYFGTELSERSLVPAEHAELGAINFDEWFAQSKPRS